MIPVLVRKMQRDSSEKDPALCVILPASNESALIGDCLRCVLASDWPYVETVQIVVVANGCHDDTADVARSFDDGSSARGWDLTVVELTQGSKIAALNAGDAQTQAPIRVYLDADVTMNDQLLSQLYAALSAQQALYASGAVHITAPDSWISRAYQRIWAQVPFMARGVPGCGVFAVNAAGRARWDAFPDIISDDTFVRLNFAPEERVGVPAPYDWPIANGWRNLVKVRKRQNKGVDEVEIKFPHLLNNDQDHGLGKPEMLKMALRDPIGFAVYAGVAIAVKLSGPASNDWTRGR